MDQSRIVCFEEDSIILSQGETNKIMYKILSGNVALYLNYHQSTEYLIGVLSEQRCFGEMSILCNEPNIYTVVALNNVVLLRTTEDCFDDFIQNNTKNTVDIMKNLANTILTLNLNLNLIMQELNSANHPNLPSTSELSNRIKKYASFDSTNAALFSLLK